MEINVKKLSYCILLCSSISILSGCSSDLKKDLGLVREAPDEFLVMSRPTLTAPPSFDLPKPTDTPSWKRKSHSRSQARHALFNNPEYVRKSTSSGESILLQRAQTNQRDSNIREQLALEQAEKQKDKSLLSNIVTPITGKEKEPIIDAKAEANRIRNNIEQGKPLTSDNVPVISQPNGSVLNKIIN